MECQFCTIAIILVQLKKKSHCKILQDASNIHTCTSHNLNAHHRVCNKSNTTGNICGVVPAYTSGAPEFTIIAEIKRKNV
jgi:hypothetical protein